MKLVKLVVTNIIALLFVASLHAQKSNYDHHQAFDPTFMNNTGTDYRSASGQPGPDYWQNSANYNIHVKLNDKQNTVSGNTEIMYTNNSPDKLNYLWLMLDQNLFKQNSRGNITTPVGGGRFAIRGFKGGNQIKSVNVRQDKKSYKAQFLVTDTRMQIFLQHPLKANGGKVKVSIDYAFKIPEFGADRMGRLKTKNGVIYEIAQWYPHMEVYDDIKGWNTLPYLGIGEFYLDYGNYNYEVTAPADMIVVGSGVLQNEKEVLSKKEINRLNEARKSDKTVYIVKPDEVASRKLKYDSSAMKTWRFKMNNTRDISWAASRAFVWDAARVNVPSGKSKIAMSVYPVEVANNNAWTRSTEYLKRSIEIYSKRYFEFPWKSAVNVAGVVGGMEYPGIVFCGWKAKQKELWEVTTHEIGHNWFPMIVGSNERRYMWQDEGFNTFINFYSTRAFNHGEYDEYSGLNPDKIVNKLINNDDPLMTAPAVIKRKSTILYYNKTAIGLNILRDVVVGPKRFDKAFNNYIKQWAFKHPRPIDFFRSINNSVGENLDWFWKGWFYKTWKIDQTVSQVKYVDNNPAKGALITVKNLDKMPMPVILKIVESNQSKGMVKLPVEVWQRGATWQFKYNSTVPLDSIIIDPNHQLPDVNRSNNTWVNNKLAN